MMRASARTLALATHAIACRDGDDVALEVLIGACTKKKITHMLPNVLKRLQFLAKRDARTETLAITLAREPHGSIVERIRSYAGAPEGVQTAIEIDPDVVGGFLATYKGVSYDGRIKRHIDNLRI